MAEFNIGDVVNDINTNQRGTIVKVLPFTRGDQKYSVFFSQDETRDVTERDLEKPIEVKDLFDRCVLGDDRIDAVLKHKGMSQKDLASKMGKRESEISRW